jgi:histidine triad (HIT) family protein
MPAGYRPCSGRFGHRARFVPWPAGQPAGGSAISECIFCDIIAGVVPAHIVLDDDVVVAFLDSRPVFKGHVLIAPREHLRTLADLPAASVGPFFLRVQRVSAVMPAALGCQGTFVAANNVVSQSVPHLHFHVVPRTKGDGLRGFFWPRSRYDSDAEAAEYAERMRAALT